MRFILMSVWLIVLSSCMSVTVLSRPELQQKYDIDFEKSMEENAKYGGEIFFDKVKTVIDLGRELTYTVSEEKYIHYINEKAENYTHYKTTVDTKYWRVQKIQATTILPNGETKVVPTENIKVTEHEDDDSTSKTYEFSFLGVEPGVILHLFIEKISLKDNLYTLHWNLQESLPIKVSEYQLSVPHKLYNLDWDYKTYIQNIVFEQPTFEDVSKPGEQNNISRLIKHRYNNIEPYKTESYVKPKSHLKKYIEFFPVNINAKKWTEELYGYKQWKYELKDYLLADDDVIEFIKKYIALDSDSSDEQKIAKSMKAVQENFNIEYAHAFKGGLKPKNPNDLVDNQNEKIKPRDAHVLLIAILRHLGIEAKLAYIMPFNHGKFLGAKIDRGDLAISLVYLPKQDLWINTLNKEYTPYDIHHYHQGVEAIVMEDEKSNISFKTVKKLPYRNNSSMMTIRGEVDASRTFKGSLSLSFKNTYSHHLRNLIANTATSDMNEALEKFIDKIIPGAKVIETEIGKFDSLKVEQSLKVSIEYKNMIKKIGRNYTIEPFFIKDETFINAIEDENRQNDIYFTFPSIEMTDIQIKLDKKFKLNIDRKTISKNSKYIHYQMSYFFNDSENVLQVNRMFQAKENLIPKSHLDYIKEVGKVIATTDRTKFNLN